MPKMSAAKRAVKVRNKVPLIKIIKRSKKLQVFFGVLSFAFLTLFSILFLSGLSFYKVLTQSVASALSQSSQDILNEQIYTILLVNIQNFDQRPLLADKIDFYVFDKLSKKVTIFSIDSNDVLDLPGPLGHESLSKTLALGMMGQVDSIDPGIKLLKNSIQKLFGYKVDKYLLANQTIYPKFTKLFREAGIDGFLNTETLNGLSNNMKTDLTLGEIYGTYTFVSSLPSDRISVELLDQNRIENTAELNEAMQEISYDSKVSEERKSVAILNGTNVEGLATFGSRAAVNMGARVTFVENTSKIYDKSLLITDDPDSYTARVLAAFFGIDTILTKDKAYNMNEPEIDRADVVLILGVDTARLIY